MMLLLFVLFSLLFSVVSGVGFDRLKVSVFWLLSLMICLCYFFGLWINWWIGKVLKNLFVIRNKGVLGRLVVWVWICFMGRCVVCVLVKLGDVLIRCRFSDV